MPLPKILPIDVLSDVTDVPNRDGTLVVTGLSAVVAIVEVIPNDGVVVLVEVEFSERVTGETIGVVINGETVEVIVGIELSFVVNIGDIVGLTPNDTDEGTPKDRFVVAGVVILVGISLLVETDAAAGFTPKEKLAAIGFTPNEKFVVAGAVILL